MIIRKDPHRDPALRQHAVARACGAVALDRAQDPSAARSTAPIPDSHRARHAAPIAIGFTELRPSADVRQPARAVVA